MSATASTPSWSASLASYFQYDYPGPAFELFGTGHLAALAVLGAIVAFLLWGWQDPDEVSRRRVRLLFASIMILNEVGWHYWNIANGAWTLQDHLPLHASSLSIWGSIYVLLSRNFRVYEIIYFIGIAGAVQALITPSAGIYGLPHYRAFQTLISHGMIVVAMVYMTRIEGLRPTWSSVWKTMLAINIYLVVVTAINVMLGSNYMYTLAKPQTASLFDLFGPWPWYLVAAEFIALPLFTLLYLPFVLVDRRSAKAVALADTR
jgi:hypothetical integral membrane protein (TIGR02206 family)